MSILNILWSVKVHRFGSTSQSSRLVSVIISDTQPSTIPDFLCKRVEYSDLFEGRVIEHLFWLCLPRKYIVSLLCYLFYVYLKWL
jgi:hypothetical protein